MLMALGLSGFAPIVHMAVAEGIQGLTHFPLVHIIVVCLCYVVGTLFYVTRIPEKYWPGTFDLWVSFLSFFLRLFEIFVEPFYHFPCMKGLFFFIFHFFFLKK